MDTLNKEKLFPPVAGIFFPSEKQQISGHKKHFGYLWLKDNSVGFMFTPMVPKLAEKIAKLDKKQYIGQNPIKLISQLGTSDDILQLLAFGALNAISQHIFTTGAFKFDYTTDPFGLLELNSQDSVGMVGFFTPLLRFCEQRKISLTIIEKKPELVQKGLGWEVVLDPTRLRSCNKVLITGTTVLNNSIDEILSYCSNAKKIAMVGPSASLIPDPLFERGVTVVGGSRVQDFPSFNKFCQEGLSWEPSMQKYCIVNNQYPGWKSLKNSLQ